MSKFPNIINKSKRHINCYALNIVKEHDNVNKKVSYEF